MDFEGAKSYALNYLETKVAKRFYYHNILHTLDVYKSVTELAEYEKIGAKDLVLLQIAALYHDMGIWIDYNRHEKISVLIIRKVLPDYGFNPGNIERICQLTMATRINCIPDDIQSQLLCDADLDYLGRPDYFEISGRLRQEWEACGIRTYSNEEWILLQLDFLNDHKYYTQSSRLTRDAGKRANIMKVKKLLKKV